MGYDEHGPAYPEPPIPEGGPSVWDDPAFGRKRPNLHKPSISYVTMLMGWGVAIALAAWSFWS
jgi:hypothetical protein